MNNTIAWLIIRKPELVSEAANLIGAQLAEELRQRQAVVVDQSQSF